MSRLNLNVFASPTPGFYGGGSEGGSGARLLTSLPRRPPATTPSSASPLFEGFCRQPQLGSAAERQRRSTAEEEGVGGGDASPSLSVDDPIASLSHVAAFQPMAEAAVERAAAAALAATAQKAFPPPPPPPRHLHGIAAAAATGSDDDAATPAAGKRPLLAGMQKENRLLARSKRPKGGGSSTAPGSLNPFAGFALY